MKLKEWVERRGRGAISLLQRRTGLAYTTVFYAVRNGPKRVDTAAKLARATDGEVSVDDMIASMEGEP